MALILTAVIAALSLTITASAQATPNVARTWGDNSEGQLGDGSGSWSSTSAVEVSGLSGATALAGGQDHNLALMEGGTVDAWGGDESGQLGNGTSGTGVYSDVPVAVSGLSGATAIAAGGEHSLALLAGGTVEAWGENKYGQLGNGKTTNSAVPVSVSGLSGVKAIAAGGGAEYEGEHSLALLENGTVMAWGDGGAGQLGDGKTNRSPVPIAVSGLSGVVAIASGGGHSLALLENGTVEAWGLNEYGQLGDGTSTGPQTCGVERLPCSKTPVAVSGLSEVVAIAAHGEHSLALLKNGMVEAWGLNEYGQLGDNTSTGPQKCSEPAVACSTTPVAVSGLSGVAAIAAGGYQSLALLESGIVKAWGLNEFGELGDGTSSGPEKCMDATKREVGCSTTPVTVTGLSGVKGIAGGEYHSLAFESPPTPTVTALSPNEGPLSGGSPVTITGTGFAGASAVKFGSANATSFTVGPEAGSITAVPPAGTGTVDVTVTTYGGTSATSAADHFSYLPAPTLTSISPKEGQLGGWTWVAITGTNFTGATAVKFGSSNAASFKVDSATSITAFSPPGKGTVDVTVTTYGGTTATSAADRFTYVPTVTSLSPTNGPQTGGSVVTITGTSLTGATAVKFGSVNATTFRVESDTKVIAISPGGTGTVDVTVTTPEGTTPISPADQFTYWLTPPH